MTSVIPDSFVFQEEKYRKNGYHAAAGLLHYADGPGTKLYNGSVSAMSWTMGPDATQRGYKYSYNTYNWLTGAEYGEGASLTANRDRYTERTPEFMRNGGIRRLQRHGLKADGNYGKVDNLHIYYTGNRITGVLEDADPVTTNGSMDYAGTTGKEMAVEYNEWGAMTKDEARGITSVTYDMVGNPSRVSFSSPRGGYASYVYSATGERLKATQYTSPIFQGGVAEANYLTDPESTGDNAENADNDENQDSVAPAAIDSGISDIAGMTKLEYHGPVIYRNGKVDMVRFPGGYATISGSAVTFHYYTQDYLGNNRAVVNGSTGAIEQTVAYYPYGGVIASLGISASKQPFKFGGKELVMDNGLNEYDFGARQYYQAVPHFTSIDPLCEKYYWLSPYLYCGNNPVNAVDPDGKETRLWATSLPDTKFYIPFATHTFITVSRTNHKTEYFAYGSSIGGNLGMFGGKLSRMVYDQDLKVISGVIKDPDIVKASIVINPPEGMSQNEFDQKVIETAKSFGNQEGISYFLYPYAEDQGNCNTSSSTILYKSGISKDQLNEIEDGIPNYKWGFNDIKPWTKEEQFEIINKYIRINKLEKSLNEALEQSLH